MRTKKNKKQTTGVTEAQLAYKVEVMLGQNGLAGAKFMIPWIMDAIEVYFFFPRVLLRSFFPVDMSPPPQERPDSFFCSLEQSDSQTQTQTQFEKTLKQQQQQQVYDATPNKIHAFAFNHELPPPLKFLVRFFWRPAHERNNMGVIKSLARADYPIRNPRKRGFFASCCGGKVGVGSRGRK